jgi:hypothetical protein
MKKQGFYNGKKQSMEELHQYFEALYGNFNDRKIDLVIANMSTGVKWANGMEGGYVYGHQGVKEYWIRQFSMVSSIVTPIEIKQESGSVTIKVHQVVHDLNGNLLSDEVVTHVFQLENGKIAAFDIG